MGNGARSGDRRVPCPILIQHDYLIILTEANDVGEERGVGEVVGEGDGQAGGGGVYLLARCLIGESSTVQCVVVGNAGIDEKGHIRCDCGVADDCLVVGDGLIVRDCLIEGSGSVVCRGEVVVNGLEISTMKR